MNEQELCKKRLLDLSKQADMKGIVTFSDFLNLNELNIYHTVKNTLYTQTEVFGGYDSAERQMVAFIPDALCYEWSYPFVCIHAVPQYPKSGKVTFPNGTKCVILVSDSEKLKDRRCFFRCLSPAISAISASTIIR